MRSAFITVAPDETLLNAQLLMRLARLRHLLVVTGDHLDGLLSYRELQEQIAHQLEHEAGSDRDAPLRPQAVGDAMVPLPAAVSPETSVVDAAKRLWRLRIGCLPVVEERPDGDHLVGLLTEADLICFAYGLSGARRPRR